MKPYIVLHPQISSDVDFPLGLRDRIRFDLDTTVAKHVKMAALTAPCVPGARH
jgi:hypothetical protein